MRNIKFGTKFTFRPVKSAGKKRQRIKSQKKRLLKAGMDSGFVAKMDVKTTRDTLKRLAREKKI